MKNLLYSEEIPYCPFQILYLWVRLVLHTRFHFHQLFYTTLRIDYSHVIASWVNNEITSVPDFSKYLSFMLQYINYKNGENTKALSNLHLQRSCLSFTYITSKLFNYQDRTLNTCNKLKTNKLSGHFSNLFVYPTLTFFLDFHWLVAAIMDFFKQLGSATYDVWRLNWLM